MWDDGVTMQILPFGSAPHINNRREITYLRWDPEYNNGAQWVIRDGIPVQLTDGDFGGNGGAINQGGEIAFQSGDNATDNIALFTNPIVRADFDFDEDADLGDFAILQNCLGQPEPLERACLLADRDFDNDVDLTDFEAWLTLFAGPK